MAFRVYVLFKISLILSKFFCVKHRRFYRFYHVENYVDIDFNRWWTVT